jgi:cytochrome c peroxidase
MNMTQLKALAWLPIVAALAKKALANDGGVPLPPNLGDFIKDKQAALRLGKALFWDMQVGSDGIQACASCHFAAGADNRTRNAINPICSGSRISATARSAAFSTRPRCPIRARAQSDHTARPTAGRQD